MASAAERRGVLGGFCYGHSSRAAGGVRGVLLWPQQQSGGGVRGVVLWPQQQSGRGC